MGYSIIATFLGCCSLPFTATQFSGYTLKRSRGLYLCGSFLSALKVVMWHTPSVRMPSVTEYLLTRPAAWTYSSTFL